MSTLRVLSFDVGLRNLAYTIVRYDQPVTSKHAGETKWSRFFIEGWERLDVLKECGCEAKNCNKVAIDQCIQYLSRVLNARKGVLFKNPLDFIVVERQMKKAPRNLMASVAVLSFFHNYYLFQGQVPPKIALVSAQGKLQVNAQPQGFAFHENHPSLNHHENDKKLSLAQNKTRRKKKANEVCARILQQHPHLHSAYEIFQDCGSKKDDLADCLLQAIYFMQNRMGQKKKSTIRKRAIPETASVTQKPSKIRKKSQ